MNMFQGNANLQKYSNYAFFWHSFFSLIVFLDNVFKALIALLHNDARISILVFDNINYLWY